MSTAAPALILYHDYTSPASAVAVARLQRLVDEGVPIVFEGVEAIGLDATLPVTLDVLEELARVEDAAAAEGVTLRRPRSLPPTARAHLATRIAAEQQLGASFRQVVYTAFWTDGVDLSDVGVLRDLATQAGVDPTALDDAALSPAAVSEFRRGLAGLRGEGVGGVPTLRAHGTFVSGLLPDDDVRTLASYA